jgi:hypothetical protein
MSAAHEAARRDFMHLSPEFLHFYATGGKSEAPANSQAIGPALRNIGQPSESDCPYLPIVPEGWYPESPKKAYKVDSVVQESNSSEIESLVRNGNTPVLLIEVPSGFFRVHEPWVISPGDVRGRHSVLCVGLGTLGGETLFLIRNSWGEDWGQSGHAWLGNSFINAHLDGVIVLGAIERNN